MRKSRFRRPLSRRDDPRTVFGIRLCRARKYRSRIVPNGKTPRATASAIAPANVPIPRPRIVPRLDCRDERQRAVHHREREERAFHPQPRKKDERGDWRAAQRACRVGQREPRDRLRVAETLARQRVADQRKEHPGKRCHWERQDGREPEHA